MKQSDLKQAPRILEMIQALTDQECSSVEIHNDNPDFGAGPDCLIHLVGMEPEDFEEFRADTLAGCLEAALKAKGKPVPAAAIDWAGRYAILRAVMLDILHFLGIGLPEEYRRRAIEAVDTKAEFNWRSHVPRLTDEEVAAWEERWGITGGVAETELRTLAEDIRTL